MSVFFKLGWVFLFSQALLAQSSVLPCPKVVEFVDRNQIDYTIKVRRFQGRVIFAGDQGGIPGACVALFDATHSTLLRLVQADDKGSFIVNDVSSGDYWLSVRDPQHAFCPAAARLRVRRTARTSKIVAVMKAAGIDACSYCKTE
jgi:hypothetical protein